MRKDFGYKVANSVAKRLVLPAFRQGGQSQYVPRPIPKSHDLFAQLLATIKTRLDEHWTVDKMAKYAALSPRTLLRRFRDHTGESPLVWLTMERLALARELLETTMLNVNQIANACGFTGAELLRHHFKRHFQISPLAYRAQYIPIPF